MGTAYTGQKSAVISESRGTGGFGKRQGEQRGDSCATLEEAPVVEFMETFGESRNSAGAAVAGMELQVSGFAAGTAADPFKRDTFEGITDELIVRELQGRNRVEQGFQYVHGFYLAHAKRAWLKCRAWMRRVDGSQGRCELC